MNRSSVFTNRETSWLSFNERVLREALDETNPLMERLKFLGISSSNLDEFFMVRVAGLKDQVSAGYQKPDASGMSPSEQLISISSLAHEQVLLQQDTFGKVKGWLEKQNIFFNSDPQEDTSEIWDDIFMDEIMPVITPVTLDPAHPFPFIFNKRISIIIELERDNRNWLSLIMLPENIRRIFKIKQGNRTYIQTSENIIKRNLSKLYKGFIVKRSYVFRVTRDADLDVQEEEAEDLLAIIQDSISRRNKGAVTRVEIEPGVSFELMEFLKKMVVFNDNDIYTIDGVIDLTFLLGMTDLCPSLQFPPLRKFEVENVPNDKSIFAKIREKDLFFFRPYYSFLLVSRLIAIAASDPGVLAIKMTLYRTNRDSSILASLVAAAKSGKQVSVVVELKARFDEERNIGWARNLEEAGCIVTYGIVGLKIHAKCLLIVRREAERIVRYTHLATGNYNEMTADIYTDVDLITSDDAIGRDAAQLFNYLMGYTEEKVWRKLYIAPFNLRNQLSKMIDEEIEFAKSGKPAHIIMKMNSLIDEPLITKLYEASHAGVKVNLIVRGICGLKPQVKGLSENITVRSIVGRLLEHSRIFYFANGSKERFFMSSADLMPRNLNWRVEFMTELEDADFKAALKRYMTVTLEDNTKAWALEGDKYAKQKHGRKVINSQEYFLNNRLV